MNNHPAIFYGLWDKNSAVLDCFLSHHPCTIITISRFLSEKLVAVARAHHVSVVNVDELLTDAELQSVTGATEHYFNFLRDTVTTPVIASFLNRYSHHPIITDAKITSLFYPLLNLLAALEQITARFALELVLLNEDFSPLPRTIARWARHHAIPTLHLSHAANLGRLYTVHGQSETDAVALFGVNSIGPYLDIGVPRSRLFITGNPAWDTYPQLTTQRAAIRHALLTAHAIPPDRPLVLFATTWSADLTLTQERALPEYLLQCVLHTIKTLQQTSADGVIPHLIIKDRPGLDYVQIGRNTIEQLANAIGLTPQDFSYVVLDTQQWVIAADVVVACDSNILIEAQLANTPAVNLINLNGLRLGPPFIANSGIVEVEPEHLATALQRVLHDHQYREQLLAQARAHVGFYNIGVDGHATERVAALMAKMAKKKSRRSVPAITAQQPHYVWQALDARQTALDDVGINYYSTVRHELLALLRHPPRVVLDIGCATAGTGAEIKRQYPQSTVIGIELNQSVIAIARQRIDQVIEGSAETIQLSDHGVPYASIDTVICGDVLEHVYNPWKLLKNLHPYLTPDAQIVASIPNSRHFSLLSDLAHGNWTYREAGLLDVTHIRFFTLAEIDKLFSETGYKIAEISAVSIATLEFSITGAGTHLANKSIVDLSHLVPGDSVTLGKLTLHDLTEQDIFELKAFQILVCAQPVVSQLTTAPVITTPPEETYTTWRARHHVDPITAAHLATTLDATRSPQQGVHFLLVLLNDDYPALADTVDTLAQQTTAHWQLTVFSLAPCPNSLFTTESMLDWVTLAEHTQLAAAIMAHVAASPYDWFMVSHAGVLLEPAFVTLVLTAAHQHPNWQCLYCDEERFDASKNRCDPYLKPAFNRELLYSAAYIGHAVITHRALWTVLDPTLAHDPRAFAFAAALRALERSPTAVGYVDELLVALPITIDHVTESWAPLAHTLLQQHLLRLPCVATVQAGILPDSFFITYALPDPLPLVSVLIAVNTTAAQLTTCVNSVIRHTAAGLYEIIIAHAHDMQFDDDVAQLLTSNKHIRVVTAAPATSTAQLFNLAAAAAHGDFIALLTSDTVIAQTAWLERLLALGAQQDIGIVGCRIVNTAQQVQHAGVILGLNGSAQALAGQSLTHPGYSGRLQLTQDCSALALPGFIIRHALFTTCAGFNTSAFPMQLYDVDLCLRVRALGQRIIWTPQVTLIQQSTPSIHPAHEQQAAHQLLERWGTQLTPDAAHHRYFSLRHRDWVIDGVLDVPWHSTLEPRSRLLALIPDRLTTNTRVGPVLTALSDTQHWIHFCGGMEFGRERVLPSVTELLRARPTTLLVDQAFVHTPLAALQDYAQYVPALWRVFILEDSLLELLAAPRSPIPETELVTQVRTTAQLCHRLIVPHTQAAELLQPCQLTTDIVVMPPYLDAARWTTAQVHYAPQRAQLRIGWLAPRWGWAERPHDSAMLQPLLAAVAQTAMEFEWVFIGWQPEIARTLQAEVHSHCDEHDPAALIQLDVDVCVMPQVPPTARAIHRLFACGAVGYPIIATHNPVTQSIPLTTVANETAAWIAALQQSAQQRAALSTAGQLLRTWVLTHALLTQHTASWQQILTPAVH